MSLIKHQNVNPEILLNPVIEYFFQIDKLKTYLSQTKNLDLPTFKSIILNKVDKSIKDYQQSFDIILANLNQTKEYNISIQKI